MKIYKITKQQCQQNILQDVVCRYCGGNIEPVETVDNSDQPTFWAGCMGCNHFTSGVKKSIYNLAILLVDKNCSLYDISQMCYLIEKIDYLRGKG